MPLTYVIEAQRTWLQKKVPKAGNHVKEACAMNLLRDVEERPKYVAPNVKW